VRTHTHTHIYIYIYIYILITLKVSKMTKVTSQALYKKNIEILCTTKHNVGPLRLPEGSVTVDPAVEATILSQYLYSVYTVDIDAPPNTSTKATIDPALSSITFNSTTVFKTLQKTQRKICRWS